jgi:predicted acyltransferase
MAYSIKRRTGAGQTWGQQLQHVVNRSLILIAIGVLLDSYRTGELVLSFVLVLQQIALAQLFAFFFMHGKAWLQTAAAVAVLAVHTSLYVAYGQLNGTDPWSRGLKAGVALDQILHLPFFVAKGTAGAYPEGQTTLNALSSTATILFGVLAGKLLQSDHDKTKKTCVLLLCGLAGLGFGTSLAPFVPIIKPIWTASFTLFAAGWTFLLLGLFHLVVDVMRFHRLAFPMVVAGMNSIFLYVLSNTLTPQFRHAVQALAGLPLSRLSSAGPTLTTVLVVCIEWCICYWLYRRGIFFKI